MSLLRRSIWCGVLLAAAAPALGVKPATWQNQSPKDFSEGTFDQTVVTSRGEIMLGREVTVIRETKDKDEADIVNALVRGSDGAIYAATSTEGVIYRIVSDRAKVFAKLPDKNVFSLVFAKDGALLAGTGGDRGRIVRIDAEGKFQPFFEPEDVKYIWAMARGAEGEIYAATGTDGKLFRIGPTGKDGKVLVKVKQKNILCLALDDTGLLYAGTDTEGLVYRIDPKDGKPYILYDAEEPEISALAIDSEHTVYAATASASAAKPGHELGEKPGGRPETTPGGAPTTQPKGRPSSKAPSAAIEAMRQAAEKTAAEVPSTKKAAELLARAMAGKPPTTGGAATGNAIYRIDRDGFVTEVFREPVMILALAEADGKLYAATGNEGRIYEIVPAEELSINIARLKASQAVSLLRLEDGSLIVGTANEGSIVRIGTGFAKKGTYISPALDAKQICRFGRAHWQARIPEGTRLTLATRSGNIKEPDEGPWDEWSDEMDATTYVQVSSASARFLQYRLTFETNKDKVSAVLSEIDITRQEDNRPPKIASLRVGPAKKLAQEPGMQMLKAKLMGAGVGGGAEPKPNVFVLTWNAEDPNGDSMVYDVFYRSAGRPPWIRLEKDFKETLKVWDTNTVSDDRYEIKVVAKDTPDNPVGTALSYARVSDLVMVDNTPPVIHVERLQPDGKKLHVRAVIKDALSPVTSAKYTIDSNDEWKALSPTDDIFDSPEETVDFTVEDLDVGPHRIVIMAEDDPGNDAYATRAFTIEP
jgi:hypothetical protein